MTNNHSIDENSESNNLADNHVEREDDPIDFTFLNFPDGDERDEEDDNWVELIDEDDDWGGYDEEDDSENRYDDWEDECDITRNPYYNDDLDMDQQSPEFWNSIF